PGAARGAPTAVAPQPPLSASDPRWPIGRTLAAALPSAPSAGGGIDLGLGLGRDARGRRSGGEARTERVAALLRAVGLDPALEARHPPTPSGGQRQRAAIPPAPAPDPAALV